MRNERDCKLTMPCGCQEEQYLDGYGIQTLFVLCGAYPTSVVLGSVNSGGDTGKSEFIQRRVTKVLDATPHGNWMKDLGMLALSWNCFCGEVRGT